MNSPTRYKFRHYNAANELLWASDGSGSIFPRTGEDIIRGSTVDVEVQQSQLWTPNALADEGEIDMLDVYFDAQAVRTSLYLRLYTDAGIAEADTLATIVGEESASGYGAITVTRGTDWGVPTAAGGTVMSTKTFNATGTWSALNAMVLATVATGTAGLHVAWVNLSATRSLISGDSLAVDLTVSLE